MFRRWENRCEVTLTRFRSRNADWCPSWQAGRDYGAANMQEIWMRSVRSIQSVAAISLAKYPCYPYVARMYTGVYPTYGVH